MLAGLWRTERSGPRVRCSEVRLACRLWSADFVHTCSFGLVLGGGVALVTDPFCLSACGSLLLVKEGALRGNWAFRSGGAISCDGYVHSPHCGQCTHGSSKIQRDIYCTQNTLTVAAAATAAPLLWQWRGESLRSGSHGQPGGAVWWGIVHCFISCTRCRLQFEWQQRRSSCTAIGRAGTELASTVVMTKSSLALKAWFS